MTNYTKMIKTLRECANRFEAVAASSQYAHDELMALDYGDKLRDAADALEADEKRIAELESQLPKECEFKSYADKIPNARNRYCTQCGAYLRDEEFENHTVRYCYWCGSKVKGEKTDGSV